MLIAKMCIYCFLGVRRRSNCFTVGIKMRAPQRRRQN